MYVVAPPGCKYTCLSYVWGGVHLLELNLNTVSRLRQVNGIADDDDDVPQTIRDAILGCIALGECYLWVDSLCIQQDNEALRAVEIQKMDDIYMGAVFTIAAAAGSDANAGLPGVRRNSKQVFQHVKVAGSHQMITRLPSFKNIMLSSPWEARGWTFQERVLSRRLFVFSEAQVHFFCAEM
jgi:Heterokaryon incompatibility protein (HET)